MKTRLFSFGGIGYRVPRNSTYFDIYPFTRLVPRAFNQPTIAVGSEQRNVFKKHSIVRSTVHSRDRPFARRAVRGRRIPVTTSKVFERRKDKCRDVHSDGYEHGSELFNFTKGVQRHVYLALVERVKLWTTIWHDDASHSEARSKDNARYRVVNGERLLGHDGEDRLRDESDDKDLRDLRAGKGRMCDELHYFYEYCRSSSLIFLYRNSHYLRSFEATLDRQSSD